MMIEITLEDLKKFESLTKAEIITKDVFHLMQELTTKYIDKKYLICRSCAAQQRYAYNQLINYYGRYKEQVATTTTTEDVIPTEEVTNTSETTQNEVSDSTEKEIKTANCAKCGNIFVKNNNKHKFCDDCKRK